MSTKQRGSRRSPSISKNSADKTPQSATSLSSGVRSSPVSPSRISRQREKEDLQNLNDRLVAYIDSVRRLESENSRLQSALYTYTESSSKEVGEIKSLFERELEDAKRLIDELAKEKARLEIDTSKYKAEFDEIALKLNKREREFKNAESRLKGLENEMQETRSKSEYVAQENVHLKDDNVNLKMTVSELEKQMVKLKKQLEDETLLRVDLENKNQTLKEDIQFKTQVFHKECEQLRSSKKVELEQVDNQLRDEYDSRLVLELQRIRDETEFKIAEMKDDVERRYQSKLSDVESSAKRSNSSVMLMREDIDGYKSKVDELTSELAMMQTKVQKSEARLRDTDDKLKRAHLRYDTDVVSKENDLDQLRKEMQELLMEYQELYDIKIALDMEIGAYRKLLEAEESRLNLSHSTCLPVSALSGSFLDENGTALRNGKKRRMDEEPVTVSKQDIEQSAVSKCGVEILDHDTQGLSVKLKNAGEKDVNLAGWKLQRLCDNVECIYKMPKGAVAKAGATLSLWGTDAGVTAEPLVNLVIDSKIWPIAENMITVLFDKDGNEQARRESQKSVATEKKLRSSADSRSSVANTSSVSKIFSMWKN